MKKTSRTHSATSRNVRIVPEFRQDPDVVKLARAFVAIAEKLAGAQIRSPTEQKKVA